MGTYNYVTSQKHNENFVINKILTILMNCPVI